MRIVKYEELEGPCGLYEKSLGTTADAVPFFREGEIYADLMNKSSNAYTALLPNYLDFNIIGKDIRDFFKRAIELRAKSSFCFLESIRSFLKEKQKYGIVTDNFGNFTPDGVFCSMKDYFIWQKLYFKHPIKALREE